MEDMARQSNGEMRNVGQSFTQFHPVRNTMHHCSEVATSHQPARNGDAQNRSSQF